MLFNLRSMKAASAVERKTSCSKLIVMVVVSKLANKVMTLLIYTHVLASLAQTIAK